MIVSQTEGRLVTKATEFVACAFSASTGRSAQFARSFVEGCSYAEWPFESFKWSRTLQIFSLSQDDQLLGAQGPRGLKRQIWARTSSICPLWSGVLAPGLRDNMLSVSSGCPHRTVWATWDPLRMVFPWPGIIFSFWVPAVSYSPFLPPGTPKSPFTRVCYRSLASGPGMWWHLVNMCWIVCEITSSSLNLPKSK